MASGTLDLAKIYKRDPCAHAGTATARDCILKIIGTKNSKKVFLATQDKELRKTVRKIPCVPLIYFKHNIMTLDPPSQATLVKAQRVVFSQKEKIKSKPEPSEKDTLKAMIRQVKQEKYEEKDQQRKFALKDKERNKMKIELGIKRKASGPNPLSCKKKTKIESFSEPEAQNIKKTRRKRKSKSLDTKTTS